MAKSNVFTPLNIYKFIILKVFPIRSYTTDPVAIKKMLADFKEARKKYAEFKSKKIKMSERERQYVESAYATLEFAEISINAFEKEEGYNILLEIADNKTPEFKYEIVKVKKLKQVCNDIMKGNNPIDDGMLAIVWYIKTSLDYKRSYEVERFILCVMEECYKRSLKARTESGLILENVWMKNSLKEMETAVNYMKLTFLARIFDASSALHTIGPVYYLESPKSDENDGRILMELFANREDVDDFYRFSVKIKGYDQAKQVYELMLKLISQIERSDDLDSKNDKEYFEGLAHSYFATYLTDPKEIYRLSELSSNWLEFVRNQKDDKTPAKNDQILAANEVNLRRMWIIKYDIYQQNKTQENLMELRKMAKRKVDWSKIFVPQINNVNTSYYGWWIYLDMAKCTLLVYNDQTCASNVLRKVYTELQDFVDHIPIFNNNYKGINLGLNMSEDEFVEAMLKYFDPNFESKQQNPYEDGTGFLDFVCYQYVDKIDSSPKVKLSTPLDIYKYLLIKSSIAFNDGKKLPKDQSLEKFKEYKKTYKEFMQQEISMTEEENKYVRSAYDTLRFAEMYTEYFDLNDGFKEEDFDNFDFQKFKSICSSILDGYVQEVPLLFLNMMFFRFWRHEAYEILRFLLCVMNEIMRKTRAVREENETILKSCLCIVYAIRDPEMKVNFANLIYFETVLLSSSYDYTINSVRVSEEESTKKNEIGKMLMKLFENYEGEEEFQEVLRTANNQDQAKIMFGSILKLTHDRKSTEEVQHVYDSYYFEGIAYGCFAAFVSDPAQVYKLCQKSMDLLRSCIGFDKTGNKIEDIADNDNIMGAIDENYRRMWNIKFDIYKKGKTQENYKALKEIATKRIKFGEVFLRDYEAGDWPFAAWWTRLDLIKCHLQIIKDKAAAEKCAEDLHKELMDESADIQLFKTIAGIDFDRKMSKQSFVKIVIKKFSTKF